MGLGRGNENKICDHFRYGHSIIVNAILHTELPPILEPFLFIADIARKRIFLIKRFKRDKKKVVSL